jgi:hypothetical protein
MVMVTPLPTKHAIGYALFSFQVGAPLPVERLGNGDPIADLGGDLHLEPSRGGLPGSWPLFAARLN